jgi:hypothetical protein
MDLPGGFIPQDAESISPAVSAASLLKEFL